jgi:RNA polymerase sigma factor (sigma-70 family)
VAIHGFKAWMGRRARDPLADPGPLIRRLYAYVAYRVGDGPAAEDITSCALERGVRYRASYDRSKGTPLAWLIGIANRCIADAAPRATVSLDEAGDEAAPRDLEDDILRRIEVGHAVASLDEPRTLIALRYGADMTTRQIGDILDLPPHTVQVALGRALDRLERRMRATAAAEGKAAAENV